MPKKKGKKYINNNSKRDARSQKNNDTGFFGSKQWWAWGPGKSYTWIKTMGITDSLSWPFHRASGNGGEGNRFFNRKLTGITTFLIMLGIAGLLTTLYILSVIASGGLTLLPLILVGIGVAIGSALGAALATVLLWPVVGFAISMISFVANAVAFVIANVAKLIVAGIGWTVSNILKVPYNFAKWAENKLCTVFTGKNAEKQGDRIHNDKIYNKHWRPYRGFIWVKSWTARPRDLLTEYGFFMLASLRGSLVWGLSRGKEHKPERALTWLITLGMIGVWIAAVVGVIAGVAAFSALSVLTGELLPIALIAITAAMVLLAPVIRMAVGFTLGMMTFAINAAVSAAVNAIKFVVSFFGFAITNVIVNPLAAIFFTDGKWPKWWSDDRKAPGERLGPDDYYIIEKGKGEFRQYMSAHFKYQNDVERDQKQQDSKKRNSKKQNSRKQNSSKKISLEKALNEKVRFREKNEWSLNNSTNLTPCEKALKWKKIDYVDATLINWLKQACKNGNNTAICKIYDKLDLVVQTYVDKTYYAGQTGKKPWYDNLNGNKFAQQQEQKRIQKQKKEIQQRQSGANQAHNNISTEQKKNIDAWLNKNAMLIDKYQNAINDNSNKSRQTIYDQMDSDAKEYIDFKEHNDQQNQISGDAWAFEFKQKHFKLNGHSFSANMNNNPKQKQSIQQTKGLNDNLNTQTQYNV